MAKSSTKVSLKLLIDTKTERVLFAEAPKEFIDFLFNLLRLPIGTVISLLTKNGMVGCIGKLYESVENLSDTYLLNPNQDRDILLKPNAPISGFLLPANDGHGNSTSEPSDLYICSTCCMRYGGGGGFGSSFLVTESSLYVTDAVNTKCPNCGNHMSKKLTYVGGEKDTEVTQSSGKGGYVQGVVTYMVMDDLVVQPLSTISSITLLNKFNVKDVGCLQERVVELGMEEGIKLLKASLQTNHALTSVFLKNMKA